MEDSLIQRLFAKIGIAILVIALIDLLIINWWIVKNQKSAKDEQKQQEVRTVETNPQSSPILPTLLPTPNQNLNQKDIANANTETQKIIEKEIKTIVQNAQKEIFIPIGSGSTNSNSYTDLAGLQITIDTNKYSAIDSVVFEASIWVENGNGKMYAQLYNDTDKHPVWFSEISTNSAKGVLTASGNITLDRGAKTYKVQAKTNLTEYAAHVENARIKITLK